MATSRKAAIPAAARKTLLAWIEIDDGDATGLTLPACTAEMQALHETIGIAADTGADEAAEPPAAPSALRLAPLG